MRDTPNGVMVFAAGFGTRMKPLTDTRPKPLVQVGNTTLLDHTLDLAKGADLTEIAVNTHYLGDQIEHHLSDQPIQIVNEKSILDTGGGLKNAGHLFSGPLVFTSNSDAVWHGPNPFSFLADQWENGPEAMLLCVPIHRALGRIPPGDFGLSDDRLAKRGGDLVYTGIQIIQLDAVLNHPETVFSLNAVWDDMLSRNAVSIATYPGQWCDVGRPENISLAAQLLDSPRV